MSEFTERQRFLGDIITGAVEGGTGYWAQVSQYQYEMNGEISVNVGTREGDEPHATLHVILDDESGYEKDGKALTLEIIELGVSRIVSGEVGVNTMLRRAIMHASIDSDAGQLDGEAADVIVQAGLLGEIVYG